MCVSLLSLDLNCDRIIVDSIESYILAFIVTWEVYDLSEQANTQATRIQTFQLSTYLTTSKHTLIDYPRLFPPKIT